MNGFEKLEIQIFHRNGHQFSVSPGALMASSRSPDTFELDVGDSTITEWLEAIEREETTPQLLEAIGTYLFRKVFVGAVRAAYDNALLRAQAVGAPGVRTVLSIDQSAFSLYDLPWTLLYDPDHEWWLAGTNAPHSAFTPLSFGANASVAPRPLASPLRILVVAVRPGSLAREINAESELATIEGIVRSQRDAITMASLTDERHRVTRDVLLEHMMTFRPNVLHFIGHGPMSREHAFSVPGIYLEEANGRESLLPASLLQSIIRDSGDTVRLAIFNACNTDGVAWSLARQGITAIGMRYPIVGSAAARFSVGLYHALCGGSAPDEAINRGRSSVRLGRDHDRDWFAPSLFMPIHGESLRNVDHTPAIINVTAFPFRAQVLVNNVAIEDGYTPAHVPVAPGDHSVRIKRRGITAFPRQRKVVLQAGGKATVRFFLLPASLPLAIALLVIFAIALFTQHWWISGHRVPPRMAYFPAGEFVRGVPSSPLVDVIRRHKSMLNLDVLLKAPPDTVEGRDFLIDPYEVTRQGYGNFLRSLRSTVDQQRFTPAEWKEHSNPGQSALPVGGVDWYSAAAYCKWSGKRLPSSREWERAARGTDGRFFPWGSTFDRTRTNTREGPEPGPTRGGAYSGDRSQEGVFDLVGNVSEWVADVVRIDGRDLHSLRGASWNSTGEIYGLGFFERNAEAGVRSADIGFRCARDLIRGEPVTENMVRMPAGAYKVGTERSPFVDVIRKYRMSGPTMQRVLERPAGKVALAAFAIDVHEVSNEDYSRFQRKTADTSGTNEQALVGSPTGNAESRFDQPHHPVVGVSWQSANAYCIAQGKRLPTEDEWERVVRAKEGRLYPWGNQFEPTRCNSKESAPKADGPTPIGSRADCASPEGVYDLVGNADEWTLTVAKTSTGRDGRIVRGGSWMEYGELHGLGYWRTFAATDYSGPEMGFRCVGGARRSWLETFRAWLGREAGILF